MYSIKELKLEVVHKVVWAALYLGYFQWYREPVGRSWTPKTAGNQG